MAVVRAYELRNGMPVVAALEAGEGPYSLRRGEDAVWPPVARAYGGPSDATRARLREGALAVARLIVPVMLLLVLLGAAYLYADAGLPLPVFVPLRDNSLGISDLILPGAWYAIHLTNRRYGPGYALAHLLAALAIGLVVILVNPGDVDDWVSAWPAITGRSVLAFGGAFFVANFAAITVFDGARGPRWWTAPLAASFAASLLFSAIYYPAAFMGLYPGWPQMAAAHVLLFLGMSLLLLIPYWLLRPAMRPIGGMNGY